MTDKDLKMSFLLAFPCLHVYKQDVTIKDEGCLINV